MNIFSALFGIFRQRGLVSLVKEGRSLVGFSVSAIIVSVFGGLLYGFAMGIGLGIETAIKDAIKVGLIVFLVLLFSVPIFWLAFRLLGREESFGQVAAVPLTLVSSVSIILAITSPIVFLLSVLTGFNPEAVYIHIVIVDIAILVGLYLAGTLIYHAYENPRRLIVPNVVGFLLMGVVMVVLMNFLSPFLGLRTTFSVGTDRLKDGLGIGVDRKVNNALAAAATAEQVTFRFQATNNNGDLVRDYTVTHLGNDNFIQIHLHAVPGEPYLHEQHIWILDGKYFTDFNQGCIQQVDPLELTSYITSTLPPPVYSLPGVFTSASWRAYEGNGTYTATGTTSDLDRAILKLDANTGKVLAYSLGSTDESSRAETRILEISTPELNREELEASLNQATVLGSLDQADASMKDYVQDQEFFVVRYPRNWRASNWNPELKEVTFTANCGAQEGCPALRVNTYDLAEGKNALQYAEDLGDSLELQPDYREIAIASREIDGNQVGIVEYLYDQIVKGELKTTHHIEYIFEGAENRYHLNFSAPEHQFETQRELFAAMADRFTYLQSSP